MKSVFKNEYKIEIRCPVKKVKEAMQLNQDQHPSFEIASFDKGTPGDTPQTMLLSFDKNKFCGAPVAPAEKLKAFFGAFYAVEGRPAVMEGCTRHNGALGSLERLA